MNRYIFLDTSCCDYRRRKDSLIVTRRWTGNGLHMAPRTACLVPCPERGADPELAACAAAIHDIGRIVTGRAKGTPSWGGTCAEVFAGKGPLTGERSS
jgi:hypothetical protein